MIEMANIVKRGDSYRIRVSCGLDADGKQIFRSMTWKPPAGLKEKSIQKELQRVAVSFEQECQGLSGSAAIKFEDFCKQWFDLYAEKQLRSTSLHSLHLLEPVIYAAIGHIRLDKLNTRQIQAFINNLCEDGVSRRNDSAAAKVDMHELLEERGYQMRTLAEKAGVGKSTICAVCNGDRIKAAKAIQIAEALGEQPDNLFSFYTTTSTIAPKTIHSYHSLISSVLQYAVKTGLIKDNPARNVMLPPIQAHEKDIYTLEEAQALIDSLKDAPARYRAFFVLAIYSGFRRGELLGLRWEDIDFKTGVVQVKRTMLYTKERGLFIDTTKTTKSQRAILLSQSVMNVLRIWQTEQQEAQLLCGDRWQGTGFIFTNLEGHPLHPNTPYHWLERWCEQTGQRFLGVHAFRHLNASLLIDSGTDVRTVSSMLGHSNTTTTLNIYAHSFAAAQARASEAVANLLEKKVGTA